MKGKRKEVEGGDNGGEKEDEGEAPSNGQEATGPLVNGEGKG